MITAERHVRRVATTVLTAGGVLLAQGTSSAVGAGDADFDGDGRADLAVM